MGKLRIGIFGLGGVGGFLGAHLAHRYGVHSDYEILFFARGASLEAIKKDGIFLEHANESYFARPSLVSDNPADFESLDYIIISTKTNSLDEIILALRMCISSKAVIIPVFNGLEAYEKLQETLPNNLVAQACTYIVSQKTAAGKIKCSSKFARFFFGLDCRSDERLLSLEKILKDADINAVCTEEISTYVWEKFAFISPLSTLMSYVQKNFSETFLDSKNLEDLKLLLQEFCALIKAKNIKTDENIFANTLEKIKTSMPANSTCSMQRDFASAKPSELEAMTGYVLRESAKYALKAPTYLRYYNMLSSMERLNRLKKI